MSISGGKDCQTKGIPGAHALRADVLGVLKVLQRDNAAGTEREGRNVVDEFAEHVCRSM